MVDKKMRIGFICLISLIFVLGSGPSQGKTLEVLRIGYIPLTTQLPIIVVYENHRDSRKGFHLELNKFSSFNSLEAALRVGAIDTAMIPVPMALGIAADFWEEPNRSIRIIGAVSKGGSLLVSRTPGDLTSIRNKLIGIPGLDSCENLTLRRVLSTEGLRYGLDYKTIGVPFQTAIRDLKANRLQALYLPSPYSTLSLKEKSAHVIDNQEDRLTGTLTTVVVMARRVLDRDSQVAQWWIRQLTTACDIIENDIHQAQSRQMDILQDAYFGFPKNTLAQCLKQRIGQLTFGYFMPDIDRLRKIYQDTSEIKLIMRSVDLNSLVWNQGQTPGSN